MITSTNHRMVTPPHHPHHWFQREFFYYCSNMAPHLVPLPCRSHPTMPLWREKTILRVSSSSGVGGVVVKPLLACRMSNGREPIWTRWRGDNANTQGR